MTAGASVSIGVVKTARIRRFNDLAGITVHIIDPDAIRAACSIYLVQRAVHHKRISRLTLRDPDLLCGHRHGKYAVIIVIFDLLNRRAVIFTYDLRDAPVY